MKRTVINFIFPVLLLIPYLVKAQETTTQFEKVKIAVIDLLNTPDPTFEPVINPAPMDAKTMKDLGFEQIYKNSPHKFMMRDGKQLFSYLYEQQSDTTILLLHGVLSSAYMMNKTAGLLRKNTHSKVIALDLRGHGQSEGKPGDVDYINQYVDDIVDVLLSIRKDNPHQKIILAGHSMGGGLILRYALETKVPNVDGYLLLAPHLGANAPTLRKEPLGTETEPFMKMHINRIIGLKMMNAIGETKYNDLPVLFFNLPAAMPITKYSYRANESMYPVDYKKGLSSINKPLLVVIGSNDEAFDANKYHEAISTYTNGEIHIINNETHNGIRHNAKTMEIISNWVNNHKLQ